MKFTVDVVDTRIRTTQIVVDADNEEMAREKAAAMLDSGHDLSFEVIHERQDQSEWEVTSGLQGISELIQR